MADILGVDDDEDVAPVLDRKEERITGRQSYGAWVRHTASARARPSV